ncbi:hypothetical protein PIB30_004338 [Stylosanthes scabra]|uniref:Uncharacterized protein n=1 Tax=Stylosanthes scabra TaxID=79078 RepID=A0ABU6T3F9_9FABA|nr:hypothetical protein [Stylosanthes scabra]
MKVTMIQFLPLCTFLLLAFNTHPLLAADPEPVVDKQQEPLQPGVGYYVWPLWADNGGITLGHTRNKTCPLDVIRDASFIGSPVTFRAPGLDYVPTETDLTIDFAVKTTCNEPTVWRLLKEGDHAYEIYSFKFCPSQPGVICAPVGTFVDADGTKVMAIGDNIDTYYVRFQKVSTYVQEKNPAFSIV